MKTLFKTLMLASLLPLAVACSKDDDSDDNASGQNNIESPAVNGVLPGLFSVSETTQVHFSMGNLQYTTEGTHACADGTTQPGTWRFATHQYDIVGDSNSRVSASYTGWIDLFGWGTSGWNSGAECYQPYSTSTYNAHYNPGGSNGLTGEYANADWGVYNAILGGGDTPGKWRTLTVDEWEYLINGRADAAKKWGHAKVNGVAGEVVLPDSWTLPSGCTFIEGNVDGFETNIYDNVAWGKMENAGAVFLPAAGERDGMSLYGIGNFGRYWSSSALKENRAYGAYLVRIFGTTNYDRYCGYSVRLVCEK